MTQPPNRRSTASTRTQERRWLAVLAALAALVLGACQLPSPIPEPAQDAVLPEAYLVYPGAAKTSEEFTRGYTGGMSVDGGETREPSQLQIRYQLPQPTPLQDIWNWYDTQLTAKGWSSYQDEYSLSFEKKVGSREHGITINDDDDFNGGTGEVLVDRYRVGYGIGYADETSQ